MYSVMESPYDIVIIGGGLGALECGVILSKNGYKVSIFEQDAKCGGCLQSFKRGGVTFDSGVHYVGSLADGQIMNRFFQYFGILDKLSLMRLDEDFDVITFMDGESFSYKGEYDRFISSLIEQFPSQRGGIEKYCKRIKEIGISIDIDPELIVKEPYRFTEGSNAFYDNIGISASDFIDQCVSDTTLRSLLAGTNLLYGGVRNSSTLYHHSMINHSNIEGGYKILGGTYRVADLLVDQIRANGGEVFLNSKVTSINANGAVVESIDIDNSKKVFAKKFISNLHPMRTFEILSYTSVVRKNLRSRLALLPNTYGLFSVFFQMKPNTFPYLNKNFYFYRTKDVWDSVMEGSNLLPKAIMLNTQNSSLTQKYSDVVTIISPINSSIFERWNSTRSGDRGDEYNQLKELIYNNILDFTEHFIPIKDSILHHYTASPLTYQSYTGTPMGSAYGYLKDYKNGIASFIPTRTKLNNLFLTGQNNNVHGVIGVTMTAAATCAEIVISDNQLDSKFKII